MSYFILRSVSQELSETILTMVANCSNVMNKARQPPPGVMPKGRAPSTSSLDAISPVQVSLCVDYIRPVHSDLVMPQQMCCIALSVKIVDMLHNYTGFVVLT